MIETSRRPIRPPAPDTIRLAIVHLLGSHSPDTSRNSPRSSDSRDLRPNDPANLLSHDSAGWWDERRLAPLVPPQPRSPPSHGTGRGASRAVTRPEQTA